MDTDTFDSENLVLSKPWSAKTALRWIFTIFDATIFPGILNDRILYFGKGN